MTFNEYQYLARRTQNADLNNGDRYHHALFGMCSEVGEVHSLFQHRYQGEKIMSSDLVKEIGDILWFVAELCDAAGISMEHVAERNIEKLRKRYPSGFDAERSIHRAVEGKTPVDSNE